jgi:hypothetical protein
MSTRNIPVGKGWPALEADIFTAFCELIFYKIREPRLRRAVAGIALPFYLTTVRNSAW